MATEQLPKEELKPCPFCGDRTSPTLMSHSEIEMIEDADGNDESYAVCCDFKQNGCGAVGGYHQIEAMAVVIWNRRVSA